MKITTKTKPAMQTKILKKIIKIFNCKKNEYLLKDNALIVGHAEYVQILDEDFKFDVKFFKEEDMVTFPSKIVYTINDEGDVELSKKNLDDFLKDFKEIIANHR